MLSVIGAGFGRTGTMSIKFALEYLGLGPCYHMEMVFKSPAQLPVWEAASEGKSIDWHTALAGFNSTTDWPCCHYWRELADAFPEAKILLSIRPVDRWWASFSKTIKRLLEVRNDIPDPHFRRVLQMAYKMIVAQTFGGTLDKAAVISAYQARIQEVKETIPVDRLLVFNVSEGWEPLCQFFGLPVPGIDFPKYNSVEAFWQTFGGGYPQ